MGERVSVVHVLAKRHAGHKTSTVSLVHILFLSVVVRSVWSPSRAQFGRTLLMGNWTPQEVAPYLIALTLTACTLWLVRRWQRHQLLKRCGIPGPKPGLFWGNALELGRTPIKRMTSWQERYGDVYGFFVGDRAHVVIHNPELIRECFVKNRTLFRDRPRLWISAEPFRSTISSRRGDDWERVRNALEPSFSSIKMKLLTRPINDSVDVFLEVLGGYSKKDADFDMAERSQALALDMIAKCALVMRVSD